MKIARPVITSAIAKKSATAKAKSLPEKVAVMVRLTASDRKALRRVAVDDDTTVQALMEQAAKDIIRRRQA